MPKNPIDLTGLSESDLKEIHNDVLRKLAERARAGGIGPLADGYDRHGSGHSRSGGGSTESLDQLGAKIKGGAINKGGTD